MRRSCLISPDVRRERVSSLRRDMVASHQWCDANVLPFASFCGAALGWAMSKSSRRARCKNAGEEIRTMPIDPSQRPKRFIVIPRTGVDEAAPAAATTWRLMQGAATHGSTAVQAGRRAGRRAAAKKAPQALKKVNTSPADGAVLVEASSAAQVQADAPAGAKVYEEHWYSLERPPRPWLKLSAALTAPRTRAGHTMEVVVKV